MEGEDSCPTMNHYYYYNYGDSFVSLNLPNLSLNLKYMNLFLNTDISILLDLYTKI